MSEQGLPVETGTVVPASQIENDDMAADLRAAIDSLKGETKGDARVVIDRPRDEAGRFAEKQAEDEAARKVLTLPVKDAKASPEPAKAETAPETAQQQPAAPAIKAPDALRPELKAKFAELPTEWQQEWQRRETEAHKIATRADEDRTFGKQVREVAAPYLATIQAEGGTVQAAFQQFLNTAHILRTSPPAARAQALHAIAKQFNVDLGTPLQSGQQIPEIARLEQQLGDLQRQLQEQTQQRQAKEEQSLQDEVVAFSTKPGHEHFETVSDLMLSLIAGGQIDRSKGHAATLEEAYQMAVRAHPSTFSTLQAAQADTGKQVAEQTARTNAARSAAVSITGAPAGGLKPLNGTGSVGSIEDDVRAAIATVTGRI